MSAACCKCDWPLGMFQKLLRSISIHGLDREHELLFDRSHAKLHKAHQARQEVRSRNSIFRLNSISNAQRCVQTIDCILHHRQKKEPFNCVVYKSVVGAPKSKKITNWAGRTFHFCSIPSGVWNHVENKTKPHCRQNMMQPEPWNQGVTALGSGLGCTVLQHGISPELVATMICWSCCNVDKPYCTIAVKVKLRECKV